MQVKKGFNITGLNLKLYDLYDLRNLNLYFKG